jgi:hypothetical protein
VLLEDGENMLEKIKLLVTRARGCFCVRPETTNRASLPAFAGLLNNQLKMVEAAGVEPASQANLPAATTCLVRRGFSAWRLRSDSIRPA